MKVCSVIVTYGDRFHLLKQVIDASLREGIDKIIVVDNASVENSRKQLQDLEKKLDKLEVRYFDENKGSAGGYKAGLKRAYECKDCEHIWLLDDDNQPQKDSLKVLKDFWTKNEKDNKEENLCLLSYRPDRVAYKEAIMTQNPNLVLGRKNSFLKFDILEIHLKILRFLKRKLNFQKKLNHNKIYGRVLVSPFGGMFINKKMINQIGYPNEKLFLYADDHDWSYRITKGSGEIILCTNSLLMDIDKSWNVSKVSKTSFRIIASGDPFRLYYSTRNRIIFEKKYIVSNKLIYNINMFIFKYLVIINIKNQKSKDAFLKAIKDGNLNNV